MSPRRGIVALLLIGCVTGGCAGGPILANDPIVVPIPSATPSAPPLPPDPALVSLPRDDGPHRRLTEWWYYTGHLVTDDDRRFGFEAVVFRAERGDVPTAWASHLALTDEGGNRFLYAQRSDLGPGVDRSPRTDEGIPTGFDLRVSGPPAVTGGGGDAAKSPGTEPWRLAGSNGSDRIEAVLSATEALGAGAAFGLDLTLQAEKRPLLHDRDGYVDFGPAGGSYYYSRTRLGVTGSLMVDGRWASVTGLAWFDHQWGDFIAVGGGGWDWFAINLADRTDLTFSVVHDAAGARALAYGTVIDEESVVEHLDDGDFTLEPLGSWTSPRTGFTWPVGWEIEVPSRGLSIVLTPTVLDQELDTRASSGVVYWEGSQHVVAAGLEGPLDGEAYVEVTRYQPGGSPRPSGS